MEKILTQILLIEDNDADILLLREALEQDALVSFRVTTADRLKAGIKFLQEIDFDVILLDLGLPDSQGLDTFIKLHKESPDIPIVILSGLTDEDLALQAIQFGAQDYLVKRQETWETAARTIRYAMERQRSQIALRESENRFRALFEHSPVAYQALDTDGKFVDFNIQLCELLGYEPHELMGESFDEFWSAETRATFPRKFDRFKRDGKMEADLQLVKKDGTVIEVLLQGKIQYDLHGDITKTHCILHDITSRKIAEQALRETQERFLAVFRFNPLSISITEPADGTIIDANESFLNMFGYTRPEVLRQTTLDLNMWQNPHDREENIKKLRRHGEVTNAEIKFRKKTGEIINALASYRLIELNGKQYMLNMLNDITDRKQTEQALNDNEKRFNALLENGLDNISLLSADGALIWESPATIRTLDYKPDEFVGLNIFELLHPDDRERILKQFADLVQKPGSRERDTFRLRRSDGSWRCVEAVVTNLLNEPSVNAMVVNYHDITERKQAEEKVRDGEEQLRSIFENATVGIFQSTPEGRFLKVNPALAKIYGYASPDEMLASITDIASQIYVNPSDRENFIRPLIEKGEIHDFIGENLRHDGRQIWTQSSARAVKDSSGKLLYYEGFIREITDRKQSQTETEKYAEDLALINSLNEAVNRGESLNQILRLLVNECRNIFQARDAGFYVLSSDRKNLILEQFTMPEALRSKIEKLIGLPLSGIRIPVSPNSHYYEIERAREGSITNDPDEIQAWVDEFLQSASLPGILRPAIQKLGRKLIQALGIGSVLSIPFYAEQKSIGLLQLTSTYNFTETDLRRLKNIRGQVAAIILRKQATEALQSSEIRWRTLIQNLPAFIVEAEPGGTILALNQVQPGFSLDDYIGHSLFDVPAPDSGQQFRQAFAQVLEEATIVEYEAPGYGPNREPAWYHRQIVPILENDKIRSVLIVARDITKRKQAEEKLRESEARFSSIFHANPTRVCITRFEDGLFLDVNETFLKSSGYAREEVIGHTSLELNDWVDPQERIRFRNLLKEHGRIQNFETQLRQKSGNFIDVIMSAELIELFGESCILSVSLDITERKQVEEQQRESGKWYRTLFENSPIAIWEEDFSEVKKYLDSLKQQGITDFRAYFVSHPDVINKCSLMMRVLNVNEAAVQMYRAESKAQLIENTNQNVSHGEQEHNYEDFIAIVEGRASNSWDGADETFTGESIKIALSWSVVPGYEADYSKVIVTTIDITERKQMEVELRQSEEKYRSLIESSSSVIATIDADGYFWFVNDQAAQQLGRQPADVVGKRMNDLFPPEIAAKQLQSIQRVIALNQGQMIEAPTIVNGQRRWYQNNIQPIRDGSGKAVLALLNSMDITERKRAELELKRSSDEFTALYEITKDLSVELNVPKLLEQIVERTNKLLESSGGFIYLYDPGQNDLRLTVTTDLDISPGTRLKIGEGMAGKVALTREPLIVDNYQNWQGQASIFADQPFRSIVEVPMLSGGELIGVLGVEVKEGSTRIFNETDARLLSLFAGYAASAVRNARLLNETTVNAQQLSLLYDAGLILNRELDPQNQLNLLFGMVQYALNADNVVFFRYDDTQRELFAESGVGAVMELAEIRELKFTLGEERGLVGWVAQNRTPFYLGDVQMDVRWVNIDSGIHSVFWVPVEYEKRLLGILTVASTRVDVFSKQDQQMVVLFANQIAVAMENAHLFDALQNELAERRQAEQALAQSESLYRQAIEVAGAVPYYQSYYDNGQRIKYEFIGEGIRDITGYGPEEFTATLWDSLTLDIHLVKELSGYSLDEAIQRVRSGENPIWTCEHRIRHRNGEIRWVFEAAVEVLDEHGGSRGSIGMYQDITERKQVESALRKGEERYRGIFEGVQDAILVETPTGEILDVNQRACEMYGYSREEFLTKKTIDLIPVGQQTIALDESGLKDLSYRPVETVDIRANGEEFPVEISGRLYDFEDQKVFLVVVRDITKRRQAEITLRESERRYRALFEDMPIAIWEEDFSLVKNYLDSLKQQGVTNFQAYFESHPEAVAECAALVKILDVNNATLEMYRIDSKQELFNLKQILSAEALMSFKDELISLANGQTKFDLEGADQRSDGEQIEINLNWAIVPGYEADLSKVIVSITDITERKQAEKALSKSEQRYRTLINQIPAGVYINDASTNPGRTEFVSPYIQTMLGFTPDEWIQGGEELWKDRLHPEEQERVQAEYKQSIENDEPLDFEYRMLTKDERVIWVHDQATALRDDTGKPHAFHGMMYDITERKQAEASLRESEQRFRTLIDQIPAVVYIDDASTNPGRVVFLSPYIQTMLGYTPDEWIQGGEELWKDRLYPDDRSRVLDQYKRSIENDEPLDLEYRLFAKDERVVWVRDQATTLRDSTGKPYSVHGLMQDITERKNVEEALRVSEEKMQTLFEVLPVGVSVLNRDSQITQMNPALERILDISKEGLVSGTYKSRQYHRGDGTLMLPAEFASVRALAEQRAVHNVEAGVVKEDGTIVWTSVSAAPIGLAELSVVVVTVDITERRRAESERQALVEIMRGAVSTNDLLEYLSLVHQSIAKMIQAENFFVILHNKDTGLFEEIYSVDEYDQPEPPSKLEKSISAYVFRSGESLRLTPALFDELVAGGEVELVGKNSASWLGVPLITSNKTVGVMVVQDYENADQYSESDQDFLTSIAGQVALAVERKQAEAELSSLNQQLRLILNSAGEGIYGIDTDGNLTFINPAAAEMLGWEIAELIGKNGHNTFHHTHPDGRPYLVNECPIYMAFQDGTTHSVDNDLFWRKDATSFPVEYISTPVYDGDNIIGTVVVIKDITQRKQAETEISHQLSELEALYENGLAISRMLEPKQIAQRIVQVLDQKMKWHHAAVRILHPELGRLELLALSQPGLDEVQINEQIERLNQFIINQEYGLSGWVIKHRTAFRSGKLKENPNYVETYPGIQSGLYVPIRSGEEIIGSIAVESEQENAFAERDERLLITLANQAAISFVNARLYLRLQHELNERSYTEEKIRKLNTELEQRVQERTLEIETAHQRLDLATALSGIGVWELKAGRDTFYWDERMHEIYGTAPDHFNPTLSEWLNFIHPDDQQAEAEKRRLAITQAGPYESAYRVMRADGSIRYINSHAVVLVDEARNFKNMIGMNMDITTIKQAEETLRMANNELERALRVKDEFLANMSHELRTPLNAILGLSESLEEQIAGLLNEKQQKYVRTISESGHHLLTLINDILDLAKIEAGQIKLDINKMDVHAVCQSSLRMIKQLAQKKNQHIELDIDEHIDLIWADERRLKQMIVNLLSNAVKFTPEGGKIGLEVEADKSDNQIVITVWDSGIGIKDSDLMRLFQPFVQLDSSLSRESAGTGLGLALVAQMARLHGGSVSATSQPGVGSRFTITLPWEPALSMDTITRMKITGTFRALRPGTENSRRTILLVEDTEEVVMMVRDYLESAAYKVVTATNGMDGIEQAKKVRPDLILMDVQMPGMDGLEATQILRREPDFQHTPIIALTALAMSNDRERCLAAGMDEYISKPVNLKALVKIIQSFLATDEKSQPS
jgi:PAS domain S-box-containing protein